MPALRRQGGRATRHVDHQAAHIGLSGCAEQVGDDRPGRGTGDHLREPGEATDDVVIGNDIDARTAPGVVRPAAPGDEFEIDGRNPSVRLGRRRTLQQRLDVRNGLRSEQHIGHPMLRRRVVPRRRVRWLVGAVEDRSGDDSPDALHVVDGHAGRSRPIHGRLDDVVPSTLGYCPQVDDGERPLVAVQVERAVRAEPPAQIRCGIDRLVQRGPGAGVRRRRAPADDERGVEPRPLFGGVDELGEHDGRSSRPARPQPTTGDDRSASALESIAVAQQAEAEIGVGRLVVERLIEPATPLDELPAHDDLWRGQLTGAGIADPVDRIVRGVRHKAAEVRLPGRRGDLDNSTVGTSHRRGIGPSIEALPDHLQGVRREQVGSIEEQHRLGVEVAQTRVAGGRSTPGSAVAEQFDSRVGEAERLDDRSDVLSRCVVDHHAAPVRIGLPPDTAQRVNEEVSIAVDGDDDPEGRLRAELRRPMRSAQPPEASRRPALGEPPQRAIGST